MLNRLDSDVIIQLYDLHIYLSRSNKSIELPTQYVFTVISCLVFQFCNYLLQLFLFQTFFIRKPLTLNSIFMCPQSSRNSFWSVEPSEGELSPRGELNLRVVANLIDTLHFGDRLKVSIQHGQTQTITLSAIGIGTPIVSDKPFAPSLDLGTYFR